MLKRLSKRIGVLAFALTAGALLQPMTALAADRNHGQNDFADRGRTQVVRQYREPARRDDWNRRPVMRSEERVVVRTAPRYYTPGYYAGGYYAPAAPCR